VEESAITASFAAVAPAATARRAQIARPSAQPAFFGRKQVAVRVSTRVNAQYSPEQLEFLQRRAAERGESFSAPSGGASYSAPSAPAYNASAGLTPEQQAAYNARSGPAKPYVPIKKKKGVQFGASGAPAARSYASASVSSGRSVGASQSDARPAPITDTSGLSPEQLAFLERRKSDDGSGNGR